MAIHLKFLFSLLLVIGLLWLFPSPVLAQTSWTGACVVGSGIDAVATLQGITCLFQNVLSVMLRLLGLALLIMLIVGGFKMLTSGGDPKGMEAGKQTLTLAIGGLVVALIVWFALVLIEQITGVQVTQFILNIP